MTPIQRKIITIDQWNKAADDYDFGLKHAVEIARDLGVHPSTVSREFKRRGCQKGSKAAQTNAALEILLDHQSRQKREARRPAEEARAEAFKGTERLIHEMMQSLVAASKAGDLSLAARVIERTGRAMGVKPLR
jgi:hypothetical protein